MDYRKIALKTGKQATYGLWCMVSCVLGTSLLGLAAPKWTTQNGFAIITVAGGIFIVSLIWALWCFREATITRRYAKDLEKALHS